MLCGLEQMKGKAELEEADSEEEPLKEATQEELQAEVNRQSAFVDELLPGSARAPAKRGRAAGLGAGVRSGPGGLLISRFTPTAAAAAPPTEPASASGGQARKKAKTREEAKAEVAVNPTLARLFKGGPKRKEADLPEQEDEGVEEQPEVEEEVAADGGADWLTSLGEEQGEAAEEEVDWLTSLKDEQGVRAKERAKAAVQFEAWMGQPFDIPPFWRPQTAKEIATAFWSKRSFLRSRIKKFQKDAMYREKKRGVVRQRHFY